MAPRGNNNDNRGRGRWRGRGASSFRGRPGRGQFPNRGGGGGGRPLYRNMDIIDVDIQLYADDSPVSRIDSPTPSARGRGNFRGHGRGWGRARGPSTPLNLQVFNSGKHPSPPPRREDGPTPTGRGRGPSRGLGARYNADMPLSKLLALERPYLRPINFVPAQLTPVLFQTEEEILEVHEIQEPEDHVPTADQVTRVFSHQETPPPQESFFQDTGTDLFAEGGSVPVVTVDFGSLDKLLDETPSTLQVSQSELFSENVDPSKQVTSEAGQGIRTSIFDAIKAELRIGSEQHVSKAPPDVVQTPRTNEVQVAEPQHLEETLITAYQETQRYAEPLIENDEDAPEDAPEDQRPAFVMDAVPAQDPTVQEKVTYTVIADGSVPLGSNLPGDDEVIVYDAPHPRSGRATPSKPAAVGPSMDPHGPDRRLERISSSTPTRLNANIFGPPAEYPSKSHPSSSMNVTSSPTKAPVSAPTQAFAGMSFSSDAISKVAEINREQTASPRSRRLTKRDRKTRVVQRNGKRKDSFESYGAMLEERHLHDDELEQYKGRGTREGSDIDWGDEDSGSDAPVHATDDDAVERVTSSLGGMSIDGDIDLQAMTSFVKSMSREGMQHTSMDDIGDGEKLRLEDEEDDESPSGSEDSDVDLEIDAAVNAEEELLVGEDGGTFNLGSEDEEEDDISSDEEQTPTRDFQARLNRVRESAKAKGKARESAFSAAQPSPDGLFGGRMATLRERGKARAEDSSEEDEEDDSDDFDADFIWADEEDYLNDIQDLLDDNEFLMSDKKQRKALFKAIQNGDFSVAPAKKKRDYGNDLPPELRVQWEKDRAKKAENKRKRLTARLEVAADPFSKHKGGKKGQKDMLRAARLAAEGWDDAPRSAATDFSRIVKQMRTYIGNLSLTTPMALPPMDKESRKTVHVIATAFGLKSHSKGKGAARYTSLSKTSRSGVRVDERKITRLLGSSGDWVGNPRDVKGRGGGAPKHKEGDEVGKEAPKINETNKGFKMLASMGWTEGGRIGVSGGLDVPLTAIIKHSKLGLGAMR